MLLSSPKIKFQLDPTGISEESSVTGVTLVTDRVLEAFSIDDQITYKIPSGTKVSRNIS